MEYFASMENVMWLIWLAVGVGFIVAELLAPGFIVVFFGVGALIAGATAFFGASVQTQIAVFGVSSLVLILLFRKFLAKVFMGSSAVEGDDDADAAIGAQAEVVEAIDPPRLGRVKYQGTFWAAEADGPIAKKTIVRILARRPGDRNAFIVSKEN